jgi:hypothetical protein
LDEDGRRWCTGSDDDGRGSRRRDDGGDLATDLAKAGLGRVAEVEALFVPVFARVHW